MYVRVNVWERTKVRRCVSYHPDHEVGEEGYPERGAQEGEQIPALPPRQATVGDGAVK